MFCPKDKVIIKRESAEKKTPGGIIVPDKVQAKHPPRRGEVVSAGPECKYVRKGDQVVFSEKDSAFDGIPDENGVMQEYVFCREEDILAVTNRDYVGREETPVE